MLLCLCQFEVMLYNCSHCYNCSFNQTAESHFFKGYIFLVLLKILSHVACEVKILPPRSIRLIPSPKALIFHFVIQEVFNIGERVTDVSAIRLEYGKQQQSNIFFSWRGDICIENHRCVIRRRVTCDHVLIRHPLSLPQNST